MNLKEGATLNRLWAKMSGESVKNLVNPISLDKCQVKCGDLSAPILDISFVRLVIENSEEWEALFEEGAQTLEFEVGPNRFEAKCNFQKKAESGLRLQIENIAPSARSNLRSFLSPKKIGESIIQDWETENLHHYHGLNESELWVDDEGSMTFLYLDQDRFDCHFMVRLKDVDSPLQVGIITRKDYLEKMDMSSDLPISPVEDKLVYERLGECRDIVTNFRPTGNKEFQIKQVLLKVVSDYLYSTRTGTPLSALERNGAAAEFTRH